MVDKYSAAVIKALTEKSNVDGDTLEPCIVCAGKQWEAQRYKGYLPAIHGGSSLVPLSQIWHSFPMAVVACKNCGYTMFFNLLTLGIEEDEPEIKPTETLPRKNSLWGSIKCWLGFGHVPDGPVRPRNEGGRRCLLCNRIECISVYDGRSWHKTRH